MIVTKYIKTILIILGIIFFQVKLSFVLEINGIIPDILLLYLFYNSLSNSNPIYSIIVGFFAGFFLDILVGDIIGISSIIYVLVGFSAAIVSREMSKMTKSMIFLIYLIIIFVTQIIYYNILFFGDNFFSILMYTIFPVVIYNTLIELFVTYILPFNFKRK